MVSLREELEYLTKMWVKSMLFTYYSEMGFSFDEAHRRAASIVDS